MLTFTKMKCSFLTRLTFEQFYMLFEIAKNDLLRQFIWRQEETWLQTNERIFKAHLLYLRELLIFYALPLDGASESIWHHNVSVQHGISIQTASNYFAHYVEEM